MNNRLNVELIEQVLNEILADKYDEQVEISLTLKKSELERICS